jgi:putative thioredoxin
MSEQHAASWVVETTEERFSQDVLERSQRGLVVVDFWAEWCAPCRLLAPLLEKLAAESAGRFTLVKANADQTPQAASQFGVSGIPAVFAVLEGAVVDFFQGLLPEPALRQWLDRLLEASALCEAKTLARDDPAAGEAQLRSLLAARPQEATIVVALANLLADRGEWGAAGELLATLEKRGFLEPEAETLKARLDLAAKAELDLDALQKASAACPDDFASRLGYAQALAGRQRYREACDACLDLVARDRRRTGEDARRLMLDVFRVLPADSELTTDYRRKLSALLY